MFRASSHDVRPPAATGVYPCTKMTQGESQTSVASNEEVMPTDSPTRNQSVATKLGHEQLGQRLTAKHLHAMTDSQLDIVAHFTGKDEQVKQSLRKFLWAALVTIVILLAGMSGLMVAVVAAFKDTKADGPVLANNEGMVMETSLASINLPLVAAPAMDLQRLAQVSSVSVTLYVINGTMLPFLKASVFAEQARTPRHTTLAAPWRGEGGRLSRYAVYPGPGWRRGRRQTSALCAQVDDGSSDIATVERLYTVTTATKLSPTSVLFETSMPNQVARPVASGAEVAVLSSAAARHILTLIREHADALSPRQLQEHGRTATDLEERVRCCCRPPSRSLPPSQAVLIADGVAKLVVVEDGALVWSGKLCASNVDCAAITVDSDEARPPAHPVVPHPRDLPVTPRDLPRPPVIPRDPPRTRRRSSFPPRRRRSSMQSRAAASSKCHRRQRQMIMIILASTLAVIKASGLTTSSTTSTELAWQEPWRSAVAGVHKGPRLLPPAAPSCQWRALGRQPLWLMEMDRRWTLPANRPRTLPALAATKNRATITVGNAKRRCSALTVAAWYAPNGKT